MPPPRKSPTTDKLGPPLLGALMRMPVDEVRERMLAALHKKGFTDLIPAHLIVLRWPGPDGLRPVEIAAQSGMSKQALNYLLGQLEEGGYLERFDDPDDRRSKRVRVTKRGYETGKVMRAEVTKIEKEFARAHGEEDLAKLRDLLLKLNGALGTMPLDPVAEES
jgi:DNA-binding MarR family transcriptional regulator